MQHHTEIRIRVAHSDLLTEAGLRSVLAKHINFHVMEPSRDGFSPDADVVIADYETGMALITAANAAANRREPAVKVVLVTPIDREWEIRFAISAGVKGYILQGCDIGELVDGITIVGQGKRYLSQSVARRIADSMTREELTGREKEVLHLLTLGSCNKAIARDLGIAVGTVKVHIKGILEKLDAESRTKAVIVAGERGLTGRLMPSAPAAGWMQKAAGRTPAQRGLQA